MKKQLATLALAIVMGVLGFAVSGVAVAGNGQPPSPPGQDKCEHGNDLKPCKDDPQPTKGKDCQEHGNQGGVNEDHCKGEDTTPTETTPTETTPTETTPTETTPTETTPTETTPTETTSTETTPTGTTPTETTPSDTEAQGTSPANSGGDPYTPPATVPDQPSSTQPTAPGASGASEPTPGIQGVPPVSTPAGEQAAVLVTTAQAPKPTRQPQKAPFTL